jgi:hypothetical protein
MTLLETNSLTLQNIICQELSPLQHLFSKLSLNNTYSTIKDIILLQCDPFEKTMNDISQKYNIPLEEFRQKKKTMSENPYQNMSLKRLQFQIKGQYPFIFCEDWDQIKCAKFLSNCEDKEEYELHPLFFKYRNLPLHKLQEKIGSKNQKNKKYMLKNIVENSCVVFTDELKLEEEYRKLSHAQLTDILKKNFPGFPIPSQKKHIILILSLF